MMTLRRDFLKHSLLQTAAAASLSPLARGSNENAVLSDPVLSESQLSFRIGLARTRTASYPLDSMDFIMMDLERPDSRTRHAHWCTGDLTGRLLEFLSCAERIDGKTDARLPDLFERIMRQRRPSGLFGRYAGQSKNVPPEEDFMSGADRLLCGLIRYHEICKDAKALDAAVGIGNRLLAQKDRWQNSKLPEILSWVTEPFARLYRITQDHRYLDFNAMINDKLMLLDERVRMHAHGHLSTLRGLQLTALFTGDRTWNEKPERARLLILERHCEMPDGNIPEVLPWSPRNEGCAIADWLMLNLNAGLLLDCDNAYEKAERIFWNALAFNQWITGGFGCRGFMPNGYGTDLQEEAWWCCTHHAGMALSDYARHAVTFRNNVIRVNLLVPGRYTLVDAGGREIRVRISTRYPATAATSIEATGVRPDVKVKVRIPGCVKQPSLSETRKGDSVQVSFNGRLGHRIERCDSGVILMYGPLVLAPTTYGRRVIADGIRTAAPDGYIPETLPPETPVLLIGDRTDAEGFLRLEQEPMPAWSYFDQGPGARTWVEGAGVNVPVKLSSGKRMELRFSPLCYSTSCLIVNETPIRMLV